MANPAVDSLAMFRSYWATRYTDSCTIKRHVAGPGVLNQTTGEYAPTYTTNYSGPCLIRPIAPGEAAAGEELLAVHGYTVHIPYTENDQLPGDLVDVTSATDTYLTGRQFVVKNVDGDTYITDRKLICEDVSSG